MLKKITRQKLDTFLARHASKERTLDIGSGGSGADTHFPNRLTVDIDPARKPEIVADAHELPFKDGEFPVVLCTEVLEHVRDPKKVISELRRVLQRGGTLILTTRFVYPIHDAPHDYWRFTRFGMLELFRDFEVVELTEETESFSAIGALIQRTVFQSRLHFNKLSKTILLLLAAVFTKLDFLIVKEYGDIKKTSEVSHIMTTGYYIVAKKI